MYIYTVDRVHHLVHLFAVRVGPDTLQEPGVRLSAKPSSSMLISLWQATLSLGTEAEREALAARGAELRKAGAKREAARAKQVIAEQVTAPGVTPAQAIMVSPLPHAQ